jgi:hypothetical protein
LLCGVNRASSITLNRGLVRGNLDCEEKLRVLGGPLEKTHWSHLLGGHTFCEVPHMRLCGQFYPDDCILSFPVSRGEAAWHCPQYFPSATAVFLIWSSCQSDFGHFDKNLGKQFWGGRL